MSVAGRTEKLNYYIATNVFQRKGVIRKTGFRRYGLRTNLNLQVTPKMKAGIRMNTTLIRRDNNLIDLWGMREILTSFPVYNKDGSFNGVNPVTGGVMRNPAADLQLRTSFNDLTNILATFYAEYKIVKGLTFKATLGPKIYWYKNNTFFSKDLPGRKAANQGGRASTEAWKLANGLMTPHACSTLPVGETFLRSGILSMNTNIRTLLFRWKLACTMTTSR